MIRGVPCLLMLCLLLGCQGAPVATVDTTPTVSTKVDETGLVVLHWRARNNHAQMTAAIEAIETAAPPPEHGEDAFRRDGFRILKLTSEQLERIRAVVGEDTPLSRTWHGEAMTWRDLLITRVETGAIAMENGRARRLPTGFVGLAGRAWSLPTIDGAGVHVQLVPHLVRQRPTSEPIRPGALRGAALSEPVEATLGPDEALLVISVAGLLPSTNDEPVADEPPVATFSSGPETAMPPTVAELLLDELPARTRGILVLQGRPHPSMQPSRTQQP